MSATKLALFTLAASLPSFASVGWAASPGELPAPERQFHQSLRIDHQPGQRFRLNLNIDAEGSRPRVAVFRGLVHRHMQLAREINIEVATQAVEALAAPAPPVVQPAPVVKPAAVCQPVCPPVRCVPRRRWRRY